MHVELRYRPGNTAACIRLQQGESVTTESGAMIAMSGNMQISTTTHKRGQGGVIKAIKRMFAGESFFLNHFEPQGGAGEVWLGTTLAGDMFTQELNGNTLIVQAGSFLAASEGINIDVGWQGFKNLFSSEGLFWLNLSGKGTVVLSSFGAIYPIEVDGDYIVDTGHIVAFDETLDFSLTKAGSSWLHSFLGGEGLVCRFRGRGTVWCQSHHPVSFGKTLTPTLKPRQA